MNNFFALLFSVTLLGSSALSAQEAWLIEMPKKFGSYLLSKSLAGETETVQGIVGKLPLLVKKKTIREVELINWKQPGKNHQAKSQYSSKAGSDKTQRNILVDTPAGENNYKLVSYGELGKAWAPTVVLIKGDQYLILLERDESSTKETVAAPNIRSLSYQGANSGTLTWYSSIPLDGKTLIFREVLEMKSEARTSPVLYGVNVVCVLNKDRESSVQLEINGKDTSDPDVVILHHNQVLLPDLKQLTGPLKKEIISMKVADIKDAGEDGSWTITIEGE